MSRNFPDWLTAYSTYAKDGISPDKFHFWTGVSVIAGALERRCWVERDRYRLFPNLYVMLVGKPAVGKTSAGNVGMTFLSKLGEGDHRKQVQFVSHEMSQASLVDQMFCSLKTMNTPQGEYSHSSAFFYAPEASASLSEIAGGGNFINTLLTLYDCPNYHTKKLRQEEVTVTNACLNILACSTFSFLEQLLPSAVIGNGFASRLSYVVQDEVLVRTPKWDGLVRPANQAELKERLLADLGEIYEMQGEFRPTEAYKRAWEEFYPENDQQVQTLKSEKMQEFVGRRITNLTKLSMVLSASEGSDLILDVRHWDRARELIAGMEEKLKGIMKNSASKIDGKGMTYHILRTLQDAGGELAREEFVPKLIQQGIDILKIDVMLKSLHQVNALMIFSGAQNRQKYRLTCDPQDYL